MASDGRSHKERVQPWLTTQQVIVFPISTLSLMFLTYGVYIMIFGLSIRVLTRRRDNPAPKLYLWCTIVLFVLDTIFVALDAVGYIQGTLVKFDALKNENWDRLFWYLRHDALKTAFIGTTNMTMSLMNLITDCMLIHRCHIIWGSRKLILYPIVGVSVIINGLMLGSAIPSTYAFSNSQKHGELFQKADDVNSASFIAAGAFNFVLTLLTAGRIWWISREARKLGGKPLSSRYNAIVAIIIESGFIYSATTLLYIILAMTIDPEAHGLMPIDLSVLSSQMAGLAPTLIIVRVAYNKSVESVQQMLSTLEFTDPSDRRQSASALPTTVDLRSGSPPTSSEGERSSPEKVV
ncbi:hypothetical protein PQX77_006263 [Marasmius sp. AFHP31]|nr:hypothetical protein PQX77_006263 [Marasmius sp. AFHP31]